MLSSLAILICFVLGTAMVIAIAVRAGRTTNTGGSIAQVLYKTEHPEKTR
jgi:hypothetical protein